MSLLTRTQLKALFQTGLKPTQQNFSDFIDSVPNIAEKSPAGWSSQTFSYTDIQAAGLTKDFTFITLNQKQFIKTLIYHITTTFAAPSMTALNFRLWDGAFANAITPAQSIIPLGGTMQSFYPTTWSGQMMDIATTYIEKIRFTIVGAANLNALTAGSLTIYYELETLP